MESYNQKLRRFYRKSYKFFFKLKMPAIQNFENQFDNSLSQPLAFQNEFENEFELNLGNVFESYLEFNPITYYEIDVEDKLTGEIVTINENVSYDDFYENFEIEPYFEEDDNFNQDYDDFVNLHEISIDNELLFGNI